MNESGNLCIFSPDRRYRYTLLHTWKAPSEPLRTIAWIALNPSTADENRLDPTLRRIRGYSMAWGYNAFMMLNAFAYRATDPKELDAIADPVGPDNDRYLLEATANLDRVVCAWGTHAAKHDRQAQLLSLHDERRAAHRKQQRSQSLPAGHAVSAFRQEMVD